MKFLLALLAIISLTCVAWGALDGADMVKKSYHYSDEERFYQLNH